MHLWHRAAHRHNDRHSLKSELEAGNELWEEYSNCYRYTGNDCCFGGLVSRLCITAGIPVSVGTYLLSIQNPHDSGDT